MFNLQVHWETTMCQKMNPSSFQPPFCLTHPFLVFSTNQFNSQELVGKLFPWGNVCMGSHQFQQSCQSLTSRMPKEGGGSHFSPSRGQKIHSTFTQGSWTKVVAAHYSHRRNSSCAHIRQTISGCTHMVEINPICGCCVFPFTREVIP